MKILRQLCIILAIYFLGTLLQTLLHLPIPGNVLGMIILLICLCSGVIKLDQVEGISNILLDNLALFFVPASVGLIACFTLLKTSGIQILIILVLTTIIVMTVTGKVVEILKKKA